MKAKHTPGPWDIMSDVTPPLTLSETIIHYGNAPIAIITSNWLPDGMNEANARLITAAPDLLDALEMFAEEWPKRGSDNDVDVAFSLAIRAIAKAKG